MGTLNFVIAPCEKKNHHVKYHQLKKNNTNVKTKLEHLLTGIYFVKLHEKTIKSDMTRVVLYH